MWKFSYLVGVCFCVFLCTTRGEEFQLGDECEYQEDCEDISNSICNESDVCGCADDFVAAPNKTTCLELATSIGDRCEISEQCSTISNAVCLAHTCVVPEVATVLPTVPKLNKQCTKDSECTIPGQTCNNGTCAMPNIAPKTFGLDKMNVTVDKPKMIGMICSNDTDCSIEGSACTGFPKLCQCKEGLIASQNLKSCLPKAKAVGDNCSETAQCVGITGTVCEDGKCTKLETKLFKNLEDVANKLPQLMIGSTCQKDDECKHIANALCVESVCQCSDKYVTSVTSNACLLKAKQEGDPCEILKQCEDVKGTLCSKNKCVKPSVAAVKIGSGSSSMKVSQLAAAILLMKLCFV